MAARQTCGLWGSPSTSSSMASCPFRWGCSPCKTAHVTLWCLQASCVCQVGYCGEPAAVTGSLAFAHKHGFGALPYLAVFAHPYAHTLLPCPPPRAPACWSCTTLWPAARCRTRAPGPSATSSRTCSCASCTRTHGTASPRQRQACTLVGLGLDTVVPHRQGEVGWWCCPCLAWMPPLWRHCRLCLQVLHHPWVGGGPWQAVLPGVMHMPDPGLLANMNAEV
jgi:hypothetical protein